MTMTRMLLGVLGLLAVVTARPQGAQSLFGLGPSPVYSYRFAGPDQTKEESRDALGNVEGSYSVTYPDNGGTLTYSYSHRVSQPVFRTLSDGPLGPAGTVIAIGKNSKDNDFLIEMLEQRLDSRDPPTVTKTDAVLIEALPSQESEGPVTSVRFQAARPGQKAAGEGGPNQVRLGGQSAGTRGGFINSKESSFAATRGGGFINSKESSFLTGIRQESLENQELGGRNPPIITDTAVIVEAQSFGEGDDSGI